MLSNKKTTPDVSVLVPIYNTEAYLPQCLQELCAQTLKNIEIIAINDGSTDASQSILEDYAAKDDRIIIINKTNSGYGDSMNRGLREARGTYVGIVEPDDFPSRKMFELLHQAAQRFDCDVVKSNYFEHYEGRDRTIYNLAAYPYRRAFDPAEKPQIICTIPSIWTGLYRREMLATRSIGFRDTPGASFQDTSFVLKTWFAARRCVLLKKPLLHYRIDNPHSSVKTSDKVFTVCDELAESERFLRSMPERIPAFISWFHVDKLGKYRWNYERVALEEKAAFMQRVYDEFKEAQAKGELQSALFEPKDWESLMRLFKEGAKEFVALHPDTF